MKIPGEILTFYTYKVIQEFRDDENTIACKKKKKRKFLHELINSSKQTKIQFFDKTISGRKLKN